MKNKHFIYYALINVLSATIVYYLAIDALLAIIILQLVLLATTVMLTKNFMERQLGFWKSLWWYCLTNLFVMLICIVESGFQEGYSESGSMVQAVALCYFLLSVPLYFPLSYFITKKTLTTIKPASEN